MAMVSRVGKYQLYETLGAGTLSVVKLGIHVDSKEHVAIKIMDNAKISASGMSQNVRREISIMQTLEHRHIVSIRHVFSSNKSVYYVMDAFTGGKLFTKTLRGRRVREPEARKYFQQLVDAIHYCHEQGICHRGLKLSNLLLDDRTGELRVSSFRRCGYRPPHVKSKSFHAQCGSPKYRPPEMISRNKHGYDGTMVDTWACGVILYALLAGHLPFQAETTAMLNRKILYDNIVFPKAFPTDAADLVRRILVKDPAERLNLNQVKQHPWFGYGYKSTLSL